MDSCPKIKIVSATFYLAVLNKRWVKFLSPPNIFWVEDLNYYIYLFFSSIVEVWWSQHLPL